MLIHTSLTGPHTHTPDGLLHMHMVLGINLLPNSGQGTNGMWMVVQHPCERPSILASNVTWAGKLAKNQRESLFSALYF